MAKQYPKWRYPSVGWNPPTVPNPMDVPNAEPDQPVYQNEIAYQAGVRIPEQDIGQNYPTNDVPAVEGVEVDGGLNMKRLRDFANMVYPVGEEPTMEYGQDVNVRIPFTKRSLFKVSGKKMDSLAGALAAAAQGAYVPGSDPGGQFLKGFLQGYGGVRAKDYAERKAAFEAKQKEFLAQKEENSKLIGQLGLEGYKAMLKPAKSGSDAYVTLTQGMVDELRRTTGKVFPKELIGQTVPKSMLVGSPPDPGGFRGQSIDLTRQGQELQASQNWTNTDAYKGHARRVQAFSTIANLGSMGETIPDYAVTMFINKMIDPDSAVLLSESAAWKNASTLARRLMANWNLMTNKGMINPQDRKMIVELSKRILDESTSRFKSELNSRRATLATIGLNPAILQDIETPAVNTQTPAEAARKDPKLGRGGS